LFRLVTWTVRPATVPRNPSPGRSLTVLASRSGTPSFPAASWIAPASGCFECTRPADHVRGTR
jgi:hypothetical protein